MSDHAFARSSANAQDIDPRGVLAFLDAVAADGVELHSLMVVRHDHVVAEGWWAPYSATGRQLVYSVSKTFTGTATALALAEGTLSLQDRVVSFFPDELPAEVDPRVAALTVHHLLSMSTGHDEDTLTALLGVPVERWITTLLSTVPQTPVGSRHIYNNGCSLMLAYLVQRVTGEPLIDYLRPRLFEPLGIADPTWTTDHLGREVGWSGLHVRTEDLAALGELYLRDGIWRGTRLLPAGWVATASAAQISTAYQDDADWALGYGYQMWVSQHGYRADGAFGQFALVLPEQDAVVVLTSGQQITQAILDHVWTHLLPALSPTPLPLDRGAERTLVDRLAALSLAPVASDDVVDHGELGAASGAVAIASDLADPTAWYPVLTDARLARDGDRWTLSVREAGQLLTIVCGDGRWIDSAIDHPLGATVHVSASAGSVDVGARAEIVFLETPHRLRLDLRADAGGTIATMAWNVPPLDVGSLADLSA